MEKEKCTFVLLKKMSSFSGSVLVLISERIFKLIFCILFCLVLFDRTVWHAESWFPDQGLNLCPLQWKRRVSTTGPPGKSGILHFRLVLFHTHFPC